MKCATGMGIAVLAVFLLVALSPGEPATPGRRPHFIDVSSRSRIAYKSNNSFTGRKYFPQAMCGGVAIFDFDNDGRMDIFFTNGARLPELKKTDASYYNCLLHQKRDGTFEDVTATAGLTGANLDFNFGVAVGDYDNDGYEDLFVASAGKNALYHNNGDGTFTDVTDVSGIGGKPANTLSVAAAWFDYDGDGLLDLIVSNYTIWTPQTDIRCLMGERELYCDPRHYPNVPARLYHNLGHGRFTDVTEISGLARSPGKGMGISIADFNDDGRPDIFIANDTSPNSLFLNRGDGTFEEKGLEWEVAYNDTARTVSSMGCDAKDFDNDGRVDIFYNNLKTQVWQLLQNRGDRFVSYSFASQVQRLSMAYSGWSNGFIDYNNDGWKDIYSANGDIDTLGENSAQHDTMFENRGGKTFADVSEEMGKDFLHRGYQRGSAFGDLNNDGALDIVVTSLNEPPRILMNSADSGNHWLILNLVGHRSARDAIGAKVKLTTESGRVLYNHVAVSAGFMSSSDKRVHFGLGPESGIRSLEIRWPRGTVQTTTNVAADQLLKIDEPQNQDAEALFGRGESLYRGGFYQRAAEVLGEALALEPGNPHAKNLFAVALAKSGHLAEAEAAAKPLLEDRTRPLDLDLLLTYVQILDEGGRMEEARPYAERAVREQPDNPISHYWQARLLWQAGLLEAAAKEAEQSVSLAPKLPFARNLLVQIYRRMGRVEDAQRQADWLRQYDRQQATRGGP